MQMPNGTGTALFLHNGTIEVLTYGPGYGSWVKGVSRNGDVLDDQLEYDDRFGCYFHQSDDGSRIYTALTMLALDPNAPPPRVLTQAEVDAHKMTPIQVVLQSVMAQMTDPMDLTFATHVFSSPVWLHAFWVKNGHDLPKACKDILRTIFNL